MNCTPSSSLVPGYTVPFYQGQYNQAPISFGQDFRMEIGQHIKQDSLFDRTLIVTLLPNRIGYIPTDKAYMLPSEQAVGNRLKPGCAEPAMVDEFQAMMKRYMPVWQAAK